MSDRLHTTVPTRVVFGRGTLARLSAEIERLGRTRVLVVGGHAGELAEVALGSLAAGRFVGAVQHTPVAVTSEAMTVLRATEADCVVAIGGGSATGLAKALALRTGIDQVIVPTTYAGSELTAVLGETAGGVKTTRTSEAIRPGTVLYDIDLTLGLPLDLTVTSAMNALAHAVEALYAPDAEPITEGRALQAIADIASAVPALVADPSDSDTLDTLDTRTTLLRAAWLAGSCLDAVGMGLHHKVCHALGSFGLPHAATHAVLLPHVMAFTAPAVPGVMARIAKALGTDDAASGVFDLIKAAGGPTTLDGIGLSRKDIARAVELATDKPYPHPRQASGTDLAGILEAAWAGTRPATTGPSALTAQVVASFDQSPDTRLRTLAVNLVRTLHEYVRANDVTEREWETAIAFLTRTGQVSDDKRQEFVLLSDVLGVSSMVDLLTNSRTPETTPSAVLGPFYVEGPPTQADGADIAAGLPGVPLWVDVQVTDTAGRALEDAVVDVWQSNADGFYDVQLPDLDGPVLRGRFRTGEDGRLRFWSILPCEYPIPDDGPVGALLAAAGRHPWRAPHLHFLVQAAGHRRLITQLFVKGGRYLDPEGGRGDTVFGVKEELIVDFAEQAGTPPDGRAIDGSWRALEYTFRIAPSGVESGNDRST